MGETNTNNTNEGNELNTGYTPDMSPEPKETSTFASGEYKDQNTSQFEETPDFSKDYNEVVELSLQGSNNQKPKIKKIAITGIIILLAVGSILTYVYRNSLINFYMLNTKTPLEYYNYIENKSLEDSIDNFTTDYEKALTTLNDKIANGFSNDVNLNFTITPEASGLLGMGDIGAINASINSHSKDGMEKTTTGISYNGESLLTLQTFYNGKLGEIFLQLPELSNSYLMFSITDLMDQYSGEYNNSEIMNYFEDILNNKAISPETLNGLIKKYSTLILESMDSSTLEKNVQITVSGINSTYNKLSLDIPIENQYQMILSILEEVQNDEDLKELAVLLELCTPEEYTQEIAASILYLTNNKQITLDELQPFRMNVYVSNSGKIMGREFTSIEGTSFVGYLLTREGNQLGFEAWLKQDDDNFIEFTGDGTYKDGGLFGTAALNYSQYDYTYMDTSTVTYNIDFENLQTLNDSKLIGNFKITSDFMMGINLTLDFSADEQEQTMLLKVLYGNLEAAALELQVKEGTYKDFEFPSDQNDIYDGYNDMDSYVATLDIEGFIARLEEVIGMDGLGDLLYGYTLY